VSPVRYELGFYIPEYGILHSPRHENPKSYTYGANYSYNISVTVVVFVVAGCIVYVSAVVVSFIVVFLYCVCALNVCNV
jgi:hypothetical protein